MDIYCLLCGGNAHVAQALEEEIAKMLAEARPGLPPPPRTSPFHFQSADVEWQQQLCLLGPLDEAGSELFDPSDYSAEAIAAVDVRSVRLLRPLVPGNAGSGIVASPAGREYCVNGVYAFFHAGCFDIFQTTCAQAGRESWVLPERVLWAVFRHKNIDWPGYIGIDDVEYGWEIVLTQDVFVEPLANLECHPKSYDSFREWIPRYLELCIAKPQPVPRDVYLNWWCGPAALWIFKRPDIFPVKDAYNNPFHLKPLPPAVAGTSALERLPIELLTYIVEHCPRFSDLTSLLSTSKTIRHLCLNSIDTLVRKLAPARCSVPPPNLKRKAFPWLRYVHSCRLSSPSMRNRARIFGICEQIVAIALKMNDEELGQPAPPASDTEVA